MTEKERTLEAPAATWPEAVFHVLAHVDLGNLPSSLYSPAYVEWSARVFGSPAQRTLGEDLITLRMSLRDHTRMRATQALAFCWWHVHEALATVERELAELTDPAWCRACGPAVEILRSAALLEAEHLMQIAPPRIQPAWLDALDALAPYAPGLTGRICLARPLTHYGRVSGSQIWIGVPDEALSIEHVAMQAAHEATVRELDSLFDRRAEAAALVLLHTRLSGTPHIEAHRTWCQRWGVRPHHLDPARLDEAQRASIAARL